MDEIAKKSGWKEPAKKFWDLRMEVNGWSSYQIDKVEKQGQTYYRMRKK